MTARRTLVVIGAGGFGREALDVVGAVNDAGRTPPYHVLGVVDDAPSEANLARLSRRGVKYLGMLEEWLDHRPRDAAAVIGVGLPSARRHLDGLVSAADVEVVSVIHPSAGVGSDGQIGIGSVVCAGVQISTNVTLGRQVHLNSNATIGHDTVIEDFVSVNPGAVVSGDCLIRTGTLIGAGAVVLQGLDVGSDAVIGAAACVTRSVPSGVVVKGVPAR